jgi:hypothetical protein
MRGVAEAWCMVWRLFATKLETSETMEGVAINMRIALYLTDLNIKTGQVKQARTELEQIRMSIKADATRQLLADGIKTYVIKQPFAPI